MYASLNERRAFERRKRSLFRKGYDIQRLFQARVYIVIERHGHYYAYRPSQRSGNWPPDKDEAEICDAETLFPTDFQTVREAGMRGPLVSSDTEDTPSYQTPSRDESILNRSVEANESPYRNFGGEAAPYPTGYGRSQEQSRFYGGQTGTTFRNPTASSAPGEIYDTPMSEIGALNDQEIDFHEADEDTEDQKPILSLNASPRTEKTAYVTTGTDTAELTTQSIRHGQSSNLPVLSNDNGCATSHAKGQELLQSIYPSLLTKPSGFTMDSGRSQTKERNAPQSHQQMWVANHSSANSGERRSFQAPEERTQQRLSHAYTNGTHHSGSRCQTPDASPKRVSHSGRGTSTSNSSTNRRKSSPALNPLPKVPTRRQPKRRV